MGLNRKLNQARTGAVRALLAREPATVDPRRYGAEGRDAMIAVVRDRCRLVGASGRECPAGLPLHTSW